MLIAQIFPQHLDLKKRANRLDTLRRIAKRTCGPQARIIELPPCPNAFTAIEDDGSWWVQVPTPLTAWDFQKMQASLLAATQAARFVDYRSPVGTNVEWEALFVDRKEYAAATQSVSLCSEIDYFIAQLHERNIDVRVIKPTTGSVVWWFEINEIALWWAPHRGFDLSWIPSPTDPLTGDVDFVIERLVSLLSRSDSTKKSEAAQSVSSVVDVKPLCQHETHAKTDAAWHAAQFVGLQSSGEAGYAIELRDCPACKSTVARKVRGGLWEVKLEAFHGTFTLPYDWQYLIRTDVLVSEFDHHEAAIYTAEEATAAVEEFTTFCIEKHGHCNYQRKCTLLDNEGLEYSDREGDGF